MLNDLVLIGQKGKMHWLLWYGEANWTGYGVTERLNDLIIVGQIGSMNWLKWDEEANEIKVRQGD